MFGKRCYKVVDIGHVNNLKIDTQGNDIKGGVKFFSPLLTEHIGAIEELYRLLK